MRGMFAAISGLKQHQVMLDVTANDIANVNTIGYKSRARHLPGLAEPAAARRCRRRRQQRRLQRRPGRSRRRPRLDRQPDDRRRASRRPATRSTSRSRATASSRSARATPPARTRRSRRRLHPRRQLLDQPQGLPDHADRPVRHRLRASRTAADTDDVAIQVPAGATGVAIDQSGGVSYVDPDGADARHRRTASRWRRSRTPSGLERSGGNRWTVSANSGTEDRRTRRAWRRRRHDRRRGRDVQRGPRRRRSRT